MTGSATPLSASATLTPPTPVLSDNVPAGAAKASGAATLAASDVIELISSRSTSSSTVFIYDLAEQVGFGALTQSWAKSDSLAASVVSLQTRAGAGLSLVGRLSQGTSKDAAKGAVLTAYTTPTGLAGMIPSLLHLPPPALSSRLILQVPTVTPVGDRFVLSPTLSSLNPVLSVLPDNFTILLSATPQESVDLAVAAYKLPSHVIHLFDHYSSARELGRLQVPSFPSRDQVGESAQQVLQDAGYKFFDYVGDKEARTVLVVLNGPFALAAKAIAAQVSGLGVLVVRVLRPWDEDAFKAVLPSTVRRVHVLDDVATGNSQGILFVNVFSTLLDPTSPGPTVQTHPVLPARTQEYLNKPSSFIQFISTLIPGGFEEPVALDAATKIKLLFFGTPGTALSSVPKLIETTFLTSSSLTSRFLTEHDVFSRPGGITADRLLLSPKDVPSDNVPIPLSLPIAKDSEGVSTFLAVLDQQLLKSHSLLVHARPGSVVLVVSSWTGPELVSNLHSDVLRLIQERGLRVCLVDAQGIATQLAGAEGPVHSSLQSIIVYLAFLRLYLGALASEAAVIKIAKDVYPEGLQGLDLTKVNAHAWAGLVEVDVSGAQEKGDESREAALKDFEFNAIAVSTDDGETIVNGARLGSWHDAAKHLIFPSAFDLPYVLPSEDEKYPQIRSLRPDIPERTYLVTCTVNRRLTPSDYDRNVFHLEFDTSGTGLKYEIGEALGVHGWNDEAEVADFCDWYGVDPARLITIPVPGGNGEVHTRTVFQVLQQQVDLFGKPPKSFYSDLAEFAEQSADKHTLQFIGSPEGASTFKKLSEKDTVTFADVLKRYTSARPGIEVLCELVGDIKPRHYSIASAQSVVGDRVDLLVVTVDWVTPSGSPRYGQCTRYLAGLKVGQKVTVSIKPSVMKLPPNDLQPLIMAGLGTGAAPFRAFLQHRAMLVEKGIPVGPIYYYFGSRHQSQEYLYGEEIEAFIDSGVISRAGLAFSRDQPKKIYIQHKMLEDSESLARMLRNEEGVFYLCGPTWPVPDVYEALVNALVKHHNMDAITAGNYLEGLKEEERYVLEVY
ncbi:assimilatory sulfite reductase [Dentipellis sp. KUC8613]|nr:assimilatory sulfite reductase [Dentipellis sp. KUC8613]